MTNCALGVFSRRMLACFHRMPHLLTISVGENNKWENKKTIKSADSMSDDTTWKFKIQMVPIRHHQNGCAGVLEE